MFVMFAMHVCSPVRVLWRGGNGVAIHTWPQSVIRTTRGIMQCSECSRKTCDIRAASVNFSSSHKVGELRRRHVPHIVPADAAPRSSHPSHRMPSLTITTSTFRPYFLAWCLALFSCTQLLAHEHLAMQQAQREKHSPETLRFPLHITRLLSLFPFCAHASPPH